MFEKELREKNMRDIGAQKKKRTVERKTVMEVIKPRLTNN